MLFSMFQHKNYSSVWLKYNQTSTLISPERDIRDITFFCNFVGLQRNGNK